MLQTLQRRRVRRIREQVYSQIRALVSANHSRVGQKLPTSRELADQFSVSLATAQAALQMLQKEGLVSCEVGRGTYVRRTLDPAEADSADRRTIPAIAVLTGPVTGKLPLDQPGKDWTAGICFGIQHGLAEEGYALQLHSLRDDQQAMSVAERKLAKFVDALSGVVVFPVPGVNRLLEWAEQAGLPWVMINQYDHLATQNFVTADYYGGGVKVGELFARLGRERVLYLNPTTYSYSAVQKLNGMRDGLSAGGASSSHVEVCRCVSYFTADGFESTSKYLREATRPPQAIFTTGDLLALGAIKACQERGLRVPEDVAVVGSTGIEAAEHSSPTLTTVKLPMIEMGIEAARMLLRLIGKREKQSPGKILPVELVQRGSTPSVDAAT